MLVLAALHNLLKQILSLPALHTAILLTREGQLVSTAHDPPRSKDEIKVVVGLCAEVWREVGEKQGFAMLDSEYGRILVFPIRAPDADKAEQTGSERRGPIMLLALNGSSDASWDELRTKGRALADHLSKPLGRYKEYLSPPLPQRGTTSPKTSATTRLVR